VVSVEQRLAKLAAKGDRSAFEQLVDLYKEKIYYLAYRMLGNRHEAEDIIQETFLRVYMNFDRFDQTQKFSTWIYRIATNLSIDRLRKRKASYSLDAEINQGDGLDGYDRLVSEEDTPEKQLMITETQIQIRNAIDKLPEKYKSVVVLRYLHDLSLQEISDVLGMPVTTIKTRIHRGREFLRKKMNFDQLINY
jgi:RNA polymerase sigma-70 factor (ECF subfamily)